jgi:hypothetical protein
MFDQYFREKLFVEGLYEHCRSMKLLLIVAKTVEI